MKGKCVCSNNSINEDCSEDELSTPSPSPNLKSKKNKNSSTKQAKVKLRIYDKMNFREIEVDSKKTKLNFNSTFTSIKSSGNKSDIKTEYNLEILSLSSILKEDDNQKRFIYSGILLSMIFLVTITTFFLNKKFNLYELN